MFATVFDTLARLLVVEDDVLVAGDVPDPIAWLKAGSYEAVPCDFRRPSGSGVEVLRFARDKTAGTLWLLVTGEAPWNIESIAAGDGFPVLRKPVAPQDLVQALAPLSAVRHRPAHE